MNRLMVAAEVFAAAIITSCAGDTHTMSDALTARGGELYQAYCASCHGADLAGAPDWKTPNEDGSYPPPPHDSFGHTWHHPDRVLIEIVRDGSDFRQSRMPPSATNSPTKRSKRSSSSSRRVGVAKKGQTKPR